MSDDHPPAGLDRRFYAFCLDRVLAWGLYAVAAVLAILFLFTRDRVLAGAAVVAGTVVLVSLAFVLVLGLTGSSPGMAVGGLRVLDEDGDGPIGVWRALLRTIVLGAAALPTIGLGIAALALNTLRDRTGRRRGWHDRVTRAVVVDVRPPPPVEAAAPDQPRQIVNLTALRLLPAEALPEAALPQRAPAAPPGPPPASLPRAGPTTGPPDRPPVPVPSRPAPPTPPRDRWPSDQGSTRWRITFDTGESLAVDGLVLVGRRPQARFDEEPSHLVALPSADMSLSKTHAQLQVTPDGTLVVMDRGSTNGSILVRSGVTRELTAGRASTLRDGDRVRFGDRSMTVTEDDSRVGP